MLLLLNQVSLTGDRDLQINLTGDYELHINLTGDHELQKNSRLALRQYVSLVVHGINVQTFLLLMLKQMDLTGDRELWIKLTGDHELWTNLTCGHEPQKDNDGRSRAARKPDR